MVRLPASSVLACLSLSTYGEKGRYGMHDDDIPPPLRVLLSFVSSSTHYSTRVNCQACISPMLLSFRMLSHQLPSPNHLELSSKLFCFQEAETQRQATQKTIHPMMTRTTPIRRKSSARLQKLKRRQIISKKESRPSGPWPRTQEPKKKPRSLRHPNP